MNIYNKQLQIKEHLAKFLTNDETGFFKNKFPTLEQILKLIHEKEKEINVIFTNELSNINGQVLTVRCRLVDIDSGEKVETETPVFAINELVSTFIEHKTGREVDRVELVQSTYDMFERGKLITYLRRYATLSFFGMAVFGEDDDGASLTKNNPRYTKYATQMSGNKATESQIKEYIELDKKKDYDKTKFDNYIKSHYKANNLVELTQDQMNEVLAILKSKDDKK